MEWFVIACVLLVIALLLVGFAKTLGGLAELEEDQQIATAGLRILGVISFVVGAFILVLTVTYSVDSKAQGVITTFGKVSEETAKPGLHVKAPWSKVTEISTTTEGKQYHGDNAIEVRLKDGNKAFVSVATRAAAAPEKANKVFEDFRNADDPTEEFRKQVVDMQLKAAMYRHFREVDPLSLSNQSDQPLNVEEIEEKVLADLNDRSDGMINRDEMKVTITLITPDKKAQGVIDRFTDEVNKTRTAIQAQKTATEQAKANKILADSINNDPNVLVARCLDLIESGDLKLPAGGSCWPGGGTGVVIPGTN